MEAMLNISTTRVWANLKEMFTTSPKVWTKQEVESEVHYIVERLFGVDCENEMSFADLGVDSIDRLDLISEVEATFDMSILVKEMVNLATVKDLIEFVAVKKLSTKSE